MAITNTIEDGGNTMKDVKGDRGGLKIFRTCKDGLKWSKDLQCSSKFFSDGYSDERILQ
jgi:hypothetical protein